MSTALHIEIISLVDGTYEFILEPDGDMSEVQVYNGDIFEAQVNITEDEDLNVYPKSENELHKVQPTSWN